MLDLYAMPLIDLIILAVAILTVLYIIKIYNNRNSYKSNKNQILLSDNTYFDRKCYKLREQYIRLHGDSRMAAAEVLDRQIEVLKKNIRIRIWPGILIRLFMILKETDALFNYAFVLRPCDGNIVPVRPRSRAPYINIKIPKA